MNGNTTFLDQTTVAEDGTIVCGDKYNPDGLVRGDLNAPALSVVVASYLVVMIFGSVATRIKTGKWTVKTSEEHTVGQRNMGLVVGIFSMTATWVGGAFINGTAEVIFNPYLGLAWAQTPWCLALSLVVGGLFFAKKMRDKNYVTLLDPFHEKYGRFMTGLLYFPQIMGNIFYVAGILAALGATLSVVAGLRHIWSMIISAVVVVLYTIIGGLYSVCYTDMLQLVLIFFGLWLCVPFALLNDAVTPIIETSSMEGGWLGVIPPDQNVGAFLDFAFLLIFGAIPWQEVFQRLLSQKTGRRAQVLAVSSGFIVLLMSIPSIILGAVAFSTDWNATEYRDFGCIPVPDTDYPLAIPLVLRYLVPEAVTIIGLGAVSAAVMSSADSSLLGASTQFARHVYTPIMDACRSNLGSDRKVTEGECLIVMRVSTVVIAAIATVMALVVKTIIGLWYLGGDLVYVILFPELVLVLYMRDANTYGALSGFIVSLVVRLLCGEPLLGMPAYIQFPWYDEATNTQYFPFRFAIVIINLLTIFLVSYIAKFLFGVCHLPKHLDVFNNFPDDNKKGQANQKLNTPVFPAKS